MNQKDAARQAFRDRQLQDTEGGVPCAVSFIAGFLDGIKYKQKEIDELIAENAKLKEKLSNVWKEAEEFFLDD